ncbi:UPF0149 family protein [Burkholderia sp. S171]|uniref:UPF0149 family protein n=1 Tax=Burkholderia sp. S171 TaxID=1641860 RepID=UPI00131CE1CF|nr:UPF0149 family protein [Burkholderia sp. S171]
MPLLSDDELNKLNQILLSDVMSDEALTAESLDGYLSAIAIGPITLMPSQWLPGVWGPEPEDAPEFKSKKQADRVMGLIIRHYNSIIEIMENDPYSFRPILSQRKFSDDPRSYVDAEMWALGFMQGLNLCRSAWQPLFDNPDGQEWLKPFHLLGSSDLAEEEKSLVLRPDQREKFAELIPVYVASIHNYWLPFRKAVFERALASTTIQRTSPKVGRNDPCPCGSGKKFKKCCGTGSDLH